MKKFTLQTPIFNIEANFYDTAAPKIAELRRKANLSPMNIANCFYSSTEEGVIIFENLKKIGFEVIEKSARGLEDSCMEQTLIALAELHASNYHMIHSHSGGVEGFIKDNPLNKELSFYRIMGDDKMTDELYKNLLSTFALILNGAKRKDLADRLESIKEGWFQRALEATFTKPGTLVTLRHGDIWYNNVMFK